MQTLLNGDSEQIGAIIYLKFSSEHFDKLTSLRLDRPRVGLLGNCHLASDGMASVVDGRRSVAGELK